MKYAKGTVPRPSIISLLRAIRHCMLTARLGLLLFARSVHTVNDTFCNAEIRDVRRDQTLEKILENKIHEYF